MAALDFIQKYNPFTGVGAGLEQHFQNLGDIKANAPSQKAYNIEATRDLWSNVSENVTNPITRGIIDYTAPALSLVTSPIYDALQAGMRTVYDDRTGEFRGPLDNFDITNTMNPDYKGNPTPGFFTKLDQENPLSSAFERFVGAGGNLYDRWSDDEKGTIVPDKGIMKTGMSDMYPFANIPSYLLTKMLPKGLKYLQQKFKNKQGAQNAHEELRNQIINQRAAANQVRQNIQTYGNRDRPNTGINRPGGGRGQSPTGGDVAGTPFSRGGIIGAF